MSRVCQITGKKGMTGNRVSHSNRKTKRVFLPNLFKKKFFLDSESKWIRLTVSASGIRTISKLGLEVALERAKKSGYLK